MPCEHKKVHSQIGFGNNSGTTSPWICELCGEEGSDFTPYPENRYEVIKSKFSNTSTITL